MMDPSTITDLRQQASALANLAHGLLDAADDLHRRLAVIEDSQAAYASSTRRTRERLEDAS